MDGTTASDIPCSGRQSAEKKRRRPDEFNTFRKLQRREITSKRRRSFSINNAPDRFRNMHLTEEYDMFTHDPEDCDCPFIHTVMDQRSPVFEIVSAHNIVFPVTYSGVCAAFKRETNKKVCYLNTSSNEIIKKVFYNKKNESLIMVYSLATTGKFVKFRSTNIEHIQRGKPDEGFDIFASESSLKYTGSVEFDGINAKLLTYTNKDSVFKVFDLENYTLLYSFSDEQARLIKFSPGIMSLIFERNECDVQLKILSIEDGKVLKDYERSVHMNYVEFIELHNEKVFIKHENKNLQILDIGNVDAELKEVCKDQFTSPTAFMMLHRKQLILALSNGTVSVWYFTGKLLTRFEDHLVMWNADHTPYMKTICTNSDQDHLISYYNPDESVGSINVSNILNGKCVAKINTSNGYVDEEESGSSVKKKKSTRVARALEDITVLFYNEEHNEIYTDVVANGVGHITRAS